MMAHTNKTVPKVRKKNKQKSTKTNYYEHQLLNAISGRKEIAKKKKKKKKEKKKRREKKERII